MHFRFIKTWNMLKVWNVEIQKLLSLISFLLKNQNYTLYQLIILYLRTVSLKRLYIYIYIYIICIYVYIYYMYICIYVYIYMYVYMYICIYVYITRSIKVRQAQKFCKWRRKNYVVTWRIAFLSVRKFSLSRKGFLLQKSLLNALIPTVYLSGIVNYTKLFYFYNIRRM